MFKVSIDKKYYWQLRKFEQCEAERYKENNQPQKQCLYIFKKCKNVIVRIPHPIQKIHGWSINEIQILQRLNDNPRLYHWKHIVIPFKGELILSLLQDFNSKIIQQIEHAIPKQTQSLKLWMNSEIIDVFLQKSKSQVSFGHQHAFVELRNVFRTRYKNYFEINSWTSNTWQYLLQMANSQKILKNTSYDVDLMQINDFMAKFEVVNSQKYENMFDQNAKNKKRPVVEKFKDNHQIQYQNKVMRKYGLYEYLQDTK